MKLKSRRTILAGPLPMRCHRCFVRKKALDGSVDYSLQLRSSLKSRESRLTALTSQGKEEGVRGEGPRQRSRALSAACLDK